MQLRGCMPILFVFAAFLLPSTTCLVHGPIDHPHWYETRGHNASIPQVPTSMPPLLIDTFHDPLHNDLGFWHGTGENLPMHHGPGFMRLFPSDPDQNFHTQLDASGCFSLVPWQQQYLHVVFEGNEEFSVSLNEHNAECYPRRSPFPGVADTVQASRYLMRTNMDREQVSETEGDSQNASKSHRKHSWPQPKHPNKDSCDVDDDQGQVPASPGRTELYIPLSHFRINLNRVISVSFTGFYTHEPITLYRVEIVPTVPPPSTANNHFVIPEKLPNGSLVLRCSLPNSFAFGIDDGQPRYAQEVLRILDEEDVRVTFFAVGAGLSDPTTNFTNFYREMLSKGHQVALHSNTHPKMEALSTLEKIDEEILETVQVFKNELNLQSRYFRPPFGTVGARLRQRLALHIPDPYIVNWSVDVEDWLWANTSTPEKQLDAFYRNVARGGNLAVMHFLNPTTVGYLPQFIRHAKAAGLRIMRIDQCLEDPHSPPL
ncbi:Glycoside hydrolase/deacetylase beta/alpha-barrel [Penicillium capsulatum]|nr:Glycoside hydrolase/deacetylase beta/alpha-barrel [Penicillium capsulatum]